MAVLLVLSQLVNAAVGGLASQPAYAALAGVGPVDPVVGFPSWYQDANGVRLELCLRAGDPCLAGTTVTGTPSTPGNIQPETFYYVADALVSSIPGAKVKLRLALEAAFLPGPPATGKQITFGRINITGTGLKPNSTFVFTHPYGQLIGSTDETGLLRNLRDQVGCGVPCDFSLALGSQIGPFLKWDPAVAPVAPVGFLGDGITAHPITGSPTGFNSFRLQEADATGAPLPGGISAQTANFTVAGRLAGPAISTPSDLRFGSQVVNTTSVMQRATITNVGPVPLTIPGTGLAVTGANPGDFAVAATTCAGATLATDVTCTVDVSFTPAVTAARTASLTISHDQIRSPLLVPLSGIGIPPNTAPAVGLSATSLPFADQKVGTTSASQRVTVTNTGTAVLTVFDAAINGANALDYGVAADTCLSSPIASGATCTIDVTFAPTSGGARVASLTITDDAAGSPHTVALSGTGRPGLVAVSAATDPNTGFPLWYQDANGVQLQPCVLAGDPCLAGTTVAGVPSVPANFPNEVFYYVADANILKPPAQPNAKIKLRLALEAAFAAPGTAALGAGKQITFGRINITGTALKANSAYLFTHPYGQMIGTTDSTGLLRNLRDQVGCLAAPCDFTLTLQSNMGPFLKWDSAVAPAPPLGFLGDPLVAHAVVGSPPGTNGDPAGTNYFRVQQLLVDPATGQPKVDPATGNVVPDPKGLDARTNLFNVAGKLFGP